MEKQQILSTIKTIVKKETSGHLGLTEFIDFSLRESCLHVTVSEQGVAMNMQENGSAFEGWIFALKCYINFDSVVLDWVSINNGLHYNRFLLRAYFFVESYEWVSICDSKNAEMEKIRQLVENKKFWINYPKREAKKEAENKEANLERHIIDSWKKLNTNEIFNHQLPVGLFIDKISKNDLFTPGKASQIDIWKITEDTLRIYELKHKDNTNIGIISELMYYANVMRLLLNDNIHYPSPKNLKKNLRGESDFYGKIQDKTIKKLEAVFFTNKFHPLITEKKDDILRLLNENSFGIKYFQQDLPCID
ncbi:MAG: hypothetical protein IJ290_09540 [Bacteroidaceae bacterium]|nr:hypothetical protein [Bacteroidaceae bacterium]